MTKIIDSFTQAYIECALWASTDDEGEPLDANYNVCDLAPETLASMVQDCVDFRKLVQETDESLLDYWSNEQAGHDFWLTRNWHGAGFWDRGNGPAGDKLTELAHTFGSQTLYVDDDGNIKSDLG